MGWGGPGPPKLEIQPRDPPTCFAVATDEATSNEDCPVPTRADPRIAGRVGVSVSEFVGGFAGGEEGDVAPLP